MTQALYAHMNNKTIKIKKKKVWPWACSSSLTWELVGNADLHPQPPESTSVF
jgi:hypothetical protein